jgi:wyosine [tRNA(Phe)-imidazoG37] synthetase (radical SAM superfamily)
VNQPVTEEIKLEAIIGGLKEFRRGYKGRLCLQMMFVDDNEDSGAEMVRIVEEIQPDEVQLNTPLRHCAVKPLSEEQMERIEKHFKGFELSSVYEKMKPEVRVIDKVEVIKRRGVGNSAECLRLLVSIRCLMGRRQK